MDDVEPRFARKLLEDADVIWQDELAIYSLRHGVLARITRDRVKDAGSAGFDRTLAEVGERLGDAVESGSHHLGVFTQLAHHPRLRLADQITRHGQGAEDSLNY